MAISTLPPVPNRSDPPATFVTNANAFLAALSIFVTEANALQTDVNTKQANAAVSETAAAGSASDANTYAATASAAANFKGDWSTLTGALNKPSSVRHSGSYWQLLNNLADVTTSTPGVSGDWSLISTVPAVSVITVNTNAVNNTTYILNASGITLTLPASPTVGQIVGVYNGNYTTNIIGRNASNIMGSATDMTINLAYQSFKLIYSGASQGWVLG